MVFTLAMVLYPDVQKRAQAEIDSVIGRDRLPTFEDRASLPYIDAVVRETFRWQPVTPLGNLSCQVIWPALNMISQAYHMLPRVMMYTMAISFQKVRCFCPIDIKIIFNIVRQAQSSRTTLGPIYSSQLL